LKGRLLNPFLATPQGAAPTSRAARGVQRRDGGEGGGAARAGVPAAGTGTLRAPRRTEVMMMEPLAANSSCSNGGCSPGWGGAGGSFYDKGGEALAQVAQRGGGYSVPADSQDQAGGALSTWWS